MLLGLLPLAMGLGRHLHILLMVAAAIAAEGLADPLTCSAGPCGRSRSAGRWSPSSASPPRWCWAPWAPAWPCAGQQPAPGARARELKLFVPASMSTLLTGFSCLITRRKALTQVVGYLVLENGIFIFGPAAGGGDAVLVETGLLLDLFVGIFVMGIVINHITAVLTPWTPRHLAALEGLIHGMVRSSSFRSWPACWPSPSRSTDRGAWPAAGDRRRAPGRRAGRPARLRAPCRCAPGWGSTPWAGWILLVISTAVLRLRRLRAGLPALRPGTGPTGFRRLLPLPSWAMASTAGPGAPSWACSGWPWKPPPWPRRPLIYFNHNRALPGGHLEIPADRLGGHRPGPAGHLLPGLRRAHGRPAGPRCPSAG